MNLERRCRDGLPDGEAVAITGTRGRCRLISTLAVGVVAMSVSVAAWAHGDAEEHAAEPMQAQATGVRAVAQSREFELVAVAQGERLTIYLDRFANNEPVSGASLEIDRGDGTTVDAVATGDGIYSVSGDWVAQPGRHVLVFTVLTDRDSDLLAATLEIPPGEARAIAAGATPFVLSKRPSIDNVAAFLLGIVAAFGMIRLRGVG